MNTLTLLDQLDRLGFAAMRYLLSALWQSSLLFAATFALAWFLRKRRASVRHLIWVAALLAAPLLPVLTSGVRHAGAPQAPVSVLPAYAVSAPPAPLPRMEPLPEPPPSPVVSAPFVPAQSEIEPRPVMPAPRSHPWVWCLASYAAGLTLLFVWIAAGRLRIRHWIRSARPPACQRVLAAFRSALEETQPPSRRAPLPFLSPLSRVEILEGPGVPAPISTGILHPRVLLPIGLADRLSDEELRAVALHEIAHLKRRDPFVLTLTAFVRAVLFFHPLVWPAARQISALAEQCADDAVLEATGQAVPYARLLARLAEELPRRPFSAEMATGLLLGKSAFLRRVEAILSGRRHRLSRLALAGTLIAVLVSLVIALAVPLGEKKGPKSASSEKTEWGKPVEGVQVRLRAEKTAWNPGETPAFAADVRNTGKKEFHLLQSPESFKVALDGKWYSCRFNTTVDGVAFGKDKQFTIALSLKDYSNETGGLRGILTEGKHTIQAALIQLGKRSEGSLGAENPIQFRPGNIEALSNPVGIEVLSASGEPADKATPGCVADLPEFRDLDTSVTKKMLQRMIAEKGLRFILLSEDPTMQTCDYHVYRGDGENIVVMFKDGKCSGIQRMRKDASYADKLFNGLGKQAKSLQVSLRADNKVWKPGEYPALKADVRNVGQEDVAIYRDGNNAWEIEVDGQWYRSEIGTTAHALMVAPGEKILDISVPPSWTRPLLWRAKSDEDPVSRRGKLLTLDPGWHTVRVATYPMMYSVDAEGRPLTIVLSPGGPRVARGTQPTPGKPVRAVSNPVEIEIGGEPKTQPADRETSSTAAYDRSETLQSKTAPRLRYEVVANKAEIPLAGGAFVTAQLTNEGSEPVTVYWGDYTYDDQYVFQVTRPDGTDMKPAQGRLAPPLDGLNAARFRTVAPGGSLKYEMVLAPLQAANCQRFFFRDPGDHLVQASFAAITYEAANAANEGQSTLRETSRGTIESPPFHLKVSDTPDEAHAGQFGSITIKGRVTDRSGKPVEAAAVEVSGAIPEASSGQERWGGMPSLTSLDCRYTDKEGNFVFPRLPDAVAQFEIMSAHPAYPAAKTTVVSVPPKKEYAADIAMERGVTIRGVVRDDSGKPISGARVMSYQRRIEEPTTYTDTSGRFELPGVVIREDGTVRADFWKKGFDSPRDAKTSPKEAESGNWTITLKNMGDLSFGGRAVFADGSVAANADLYFYLKEEGSPRPMKTDAEGRFRGELGGPGPHSGSAWIVVSQQESIERGSRFLSSPHRWRARVQNVAPGQENIELVFENRGRLRVSLAPRKKEPVAGKFEVSCRYSYPGEQWPGVYREDIACEVLPSEGGTALFEKLAPGQYEIRVIDPQGPSWEKWTRTVTLPGPDGKLDARISMDLEAEAKQAGSLKARLITPGGQNLPATVKAGMRMPGGEWINLEVRDGLIEAGTLPAGENSLNVLCDGFLPVDRAVVIRAGETADLGEIALVALETVAGWIEGRVLYDDGSPALGTVLVGDSRNSIQVSADGSYRQQRRAGHAMVGAQLAGAARWPRSAMPIDSIIMDGGPQNLARLWDDTIFAPVEVKAGGTVHRDITIPLTDFGNVRVEWLGDPTALYGTCALIVRRGDCFFACETPNSNAAISQLAKDPIENVPCGERTAILRTMDYCGYQEAKPGEKDSVFRFDPAQAGSVTGKVAPRAAGGEQRVNLEIHHGLFLDMGCFRSPSGDRFIRQNGAVGFSKVGADGSFRFPKVGAGKYLARIEGDDSGRAIAVEVKPGAESLADFTAAPKASDPPTSQTTATTGSAPVRGSLSETMAALPETAVVESGGLKFEAGFIPEKTEIMVGEAIYVTLFVKNTGAESIFLETGGDGRSVRSYRFQFSATDEQGNPARDPNPNPSHFGGPQGAPPEIQPGKTYSEKLELAQWIAFDRPGQYTVRCARTLQFPKKQEFTRDYALVHPLATSFRLKVVDRTDPGAATRIETLGTRLRAEEDENEARLTARLLAATGDKRIVPHLLWAAQKWPGDSWALRDLAAFKADPRVIALYREALRKSRGNSRRSDAARLMGQSGNQDFVPDLLQAFAEEDDKFVLTSVAAALGQFGDKQAAPILKKHRDHDYSHLRLEVEQALVRCGEPLDVERFQAIIRSTDPTWHSAAYFISRNAGGAAPRILAECLDFEHPEASVGQSNADANPAWRNGMLLMDIAQAGGPRFDYNRIHNRPATPEETEANRQTLRKVQEWLAAQAGAKAVSETDEASAVSVADLTTAPKASDPPTTAAANVQSQPERLVARSAIEFRPGAPTAPLDEIEITKAFNEILQLRESRDAKYVPALEKILEANIASGRIHGFAAAQALFCIGTPEARSVLDRYLLAPRYETWHGIEYTACWEMAEPERSDFIRQYYLKNLSQDLAVELAAAPKWDKEGARIEFTLTLRNSSGKAFRIREQPVYSGRMLSFQDEAGRIAPSLGFVKYDGAMPKWLELEPGATHQYTIPVQIRQVADLKGDYLGLSPDAELGAKTQDTFFDIVRKGRFQVYAMVEAQPPTKAQLEKLDFGSFWTGRAVSKPIEVDISLTSPTLTVGDPVRIEVVGAPPEGPTAGPRANAGFEELAVEMKCFWWNGVNRVMRIGGDGQMAFSLVSRTGRDYASTYQLTKEDLATLASLLRATDWLRKPPEKVMAVDALEFSLSLKRNGETARADFLMQRTEPYQPLERFLTRLAEQEDLLYCLSGGKTSKGPDAASTIASDLRGLMRRPDTVQPTEPRVLDYSRFLPIMREWLAKPDGHPAGELEAAVVLAGYLRDESARRDIESLTANGKVIAEEGVPALVRIGNPASVPVLGRMARRGSGSSDAAWGLVQMGDAALPTILEIVGAPIGSDGGDSTETMIRAYIVHWKKLPAPPSAAVIKAVRADMEARRELKDHHPSTEYHQQFLRLLDDTPEQKEKAREKLNGLIRDIHVQLMAAAQSTSALKGYDAACLEERDGILSVFFLPKSERAKLGAPQPQAPNQLSLDYWPMNAPREGKYFNKVDNVRLCQFPRFHSRLYLSSILRDADADTLVKRIVVEQSAKFQERENTYGEDVANLYPPLPVHVYFPASAKKTVEFAADKEIPLNITVGTREEKDLLKLASVRFKRVKNRLYGFVRVEERAVVDTSWFISVRFFPLRPGESPGDGSHASYTTHVEPRGYPATRKGEIQVCNAPWDYAAGIRSVECEIRRYDQYRPELSVHFPVSDTAGAGAEE